MQRFLLISKCLIKNRRRFIEISTFLALQGGGGLVNQIKKSYSLSDLSQTHHEQETESNDECDITVSDTRVKRRTNNPRRNTTNSAGIYFSELDIRHEALGSIQSVEDISSGYSSGEALHIGQPPKLQSRESLVRAGSIGPRSRSVRVTRSTTSKADVSIFFLCS